MNFVCTLNQKQIDAMLAFYGPYVKLADAQHIIATIKTDHATISIYKSGKVMFQGREAEREFLYWVDVFALPVDQESPEDAIKEDFYTPSIGSDESGVGDYFGPLTVCAVYISKRDMPRLRTLNIRDSKTISDAEIVKIAPQLAKTFQYSLLVLENAKYNALTDKGYNAHQLKASMHAQCHKHLLEKIREQPKIIVDQFCTRAHYTKYTKNIHDVPRVDRFITKAETYYASVAAASIIARYSFLSHMQRLSDAIGEPLKKGASEAVTEQAAKLLKRKGSQALRNIAKIHFATTDKARNLLKTPEPS